MAGFDEACPHCDTKQVNIHGAWVARDHEHDFIMECDACRKLIAVTVHSVPEFETGKPMCQKCKRAEVGREPYCQKCQAELKALSEYNASRV